MGWAGKSKFKFLINVYKFVIKRYTFFVFCDKPLYKETVVNRTLWKAVREMVEAIKGVLKDNLLSVYVYGSAVLDDFRLGWSDIDILVLTKDECKIQCAEKLVFLRQELLKANPKNKFYRSFEGAILSLSGFLNGVKTNVIYWGTTGERIRDEYVLD